MTKKQTNEGLSDFNWGSYQTDGERIAINTKIYSDCSITDAFKKHYGIKLKKLKGAPNEMPQQLSIGSTFTASIRNISKGHVEFDTGNLKDEIMSCVDLSRFPRFQKNIPNHPVELYVTDKRKNTFVVDCIQPLYNRFFDRLSSLINTQAVYRGDDKSVTVHNLQWTYGGFTGKIDVDEVVDFTGESKQIDVFIPGSQIVLNIERDFNKWIGADVKAFVTNFNKELLRKPNLPAVICSVKKYLEHQGNVNKIELFKAYTENNDVWKTNLETSHTGVVTGVINSAKKCGVFVELPELNITGLVSVKPNELCNYKPGDDVQVRITSFDEIRYFDRDYNQLRHVIPYVISDNIIKECNLKPVLEFV